MALEKYSVEKVDYNKSTIEFIKTHHYTHSSPMNVRYAFILRELDRVWGVATFGFFSRIQSRKAFPGFLELSRLFVHDGTPKNAESFFISKCLSWLEKKSDFYGVIAYSSPSQGHSGTIYKASNFVRIAETRPSYHYQSAYHSFIHKKKVWDMAGGGSVNERNYALKQGYIRVEEDPKSVFKYDFKKKRLKPLPGQRVPTRVKTLAGISLPSDFDPSVHLVLELGKDILFCDEADYEFMLTRDWWITQAGYLTTKGEAQRFWSFHRQIMSNPGGMIVDHINRHRLDNRRCNLRVVSSSQNNQNRSRTGKWDARGVKFRRGKYEASITFQYQHRYLGRFSDIEGAKRAYDLECVQCYGRSALTNFPIEQYVIPKFCEADKILPKKIRKNTTERICSICQRKAIGKSELCKSCNIIEKRRAENQTRSVYVNRVMFTTDECINPDCHEPSFSRNLCSKHYSAIRKKEGYDKPKKRIYMCKMPDCQSQAGMVKARLCRFHWNEKEGRSHKITGRPPRDPKTKTKGKPCVVVGCMSLGFNAGGYCFKHKALHKKPFIGPEFGSRLRAFREKFGLSMLAAATIMGYSNESGMVGYEKGTKALKQERLEKLLLHFKVKELNPIG